MICEKCKIREATIQYTEVVNGRRTVHSFCAQCAREMDFGAVSALFDGEFPFAKILSALFGEEGQTESGNYAQIVCPVCGNTYQDFVENSRFGCAECYELFDILIRDSIKSLQGSDRHKGKTPKYGLKMVPESLSTMLNSNAGDDASAENGSGQGNDAGQPSGLEGLLSLTPEQKRQTAILELKKMLSEAVQNEAYEEAARIRDQIRLLEQEVNPDE